MFRFPLRPSCILLASAVAAGACNDANQPPPPAAVPAFEVVAHSPAPGAVVYLNDAITVSFSTQLDLDSVNPSSFAIEEFDAQGQPTLVAVPGVYRLANNGTTLWFQPDLPLNGAYATGGLRAGRSYLVTVTDSLHDATGQRLQAARTFTFHTRSGTTAAALYLDREARGPGRVALAVTTNPAAVPAHEVRLTFDQPLDPAVDNLIGTAWFEYQDANDPVGVFRQMPASLAIERNTYADAVLLLRPLDILPEATVVRVVVAATLRDLAGQDNVQTPDYDPVFGTFQN